MAALALGWAACGAHVALFRLSAGPAKNAHSLMLIAASSAAAIVVASSCIASDRCSLAGSESLTISKIVSVNPWSAQFAVCCVFIGLGARRAAASAGAPRCGLAIAASFAFLGASPDDDGVMGWVHGVSLLLPMASLIVFAAVSGDGASRAHAVAATCLGVASTAIVSAQPPPTGGLRMVGLLAETASLMHSTASLL